MSDKIIAQNRQARHNYQVLNTFEAGMVLLGTEVKSMRQGHLILKDSYVDIRYGELYLVNAHISPYEQGGRFNHEPERPRKLLMHKREIIRLATQVAEKGLTLVPLKVYFKEGKAKVEVGLCRGKARVDKRDDLKAEEAKREIDRAMRESRKG